MEKIFLLIKMSSRLSSLVSDGSGIGSDLKAMAEQLSSVKSR